MKQQFSYERVYYNIFDFDCSIFVCVFIVFNCDPSQERRNYKSAIGNRIDDIYLSNENFINVGNSERIYINTTWVKICLKQMNITYKPPVLKYTIFFLSCLLGRYK